MKDIPIAELREVLDYSPDTGVFVWKKSTSNYVKAGSVAGTREKKGYIAIAYKGVRYKASRLAYAFCHNEHPPGQMDHINGVRDDNRISNLRCVSGRENSCNLAHHRTGRLPGATYVNGRGKWQAQITIDKKRMYLGQFDTEEAASARYFEFITEINLSAQKLMK